MPEAVLWKKADGRIVLEWPEGAHTLEVTREMLELLINNTNRQEDLRAALDRFLLLDTQTFTGRLELLDAWNDACAHAREVLGLVTS